MFRRHFGGHGHIDFGDYAQDNQHIALAGEIRG